MQNFAEAKAALAAYISPKSQKGVYNLVSISKLMEYLDNPQDKFKAVHVAGTSGKTSTCYYIAAMLRASGAKVGLTVSPHVDEVNERVQLNARPLPEAEFCKNLGEFLRIVEKSGIKPTYFELLVAFAYWYFASQKVDYAVVEVGLGGLLDGTNVINRADKVSVITDIGLDHTDILGKTLNEIARQKGGIIKPRNQVLMYQQSREITDEIANICANKKANLALVPELKAGEIELKTLSAFGRRNWWLALAVFDFIAERDKLKMLDALTLSQIAKLVIPARMETINLANGKTLIRDGAHNSDKILALTRALKENYLNQQIAVLLAVVDSPNFKRRINLKPLLSIANRIIVAGFSSEQDLPKKSVNPQILADYCTELGAKNVTVVENSKQALSQLVKSPETILVATGSLYLMGHIKLAKQEVDTH